MSPSRLKRFLKSSLPSSPPNKRQRTDYFNSKSSTHPLDNSSLNPNAPTRHHHRRRSNDSVGSSIRTTPLDEDEVDNLSAQHDHESHGGSGGVGGGGGGSDGDDGGTTEMDKLLRVIQTSQESNSSALQELNSSIRALTDRMDAAAAAGDNSGSSINNVDRASVCLDEAVRASQHRVSFDRIDGSNDDVNCRDDDDFSHPTAPQAAAAAPKRTSCVPSRRDSVDIEEEEEQNNPLDRRRIFAQMRAKQKQSPTTKEQPKQDIETLDKEEHSIEEEEKIEIDVDRVSIRLDGVEVYAVVSAITLPTAVSSFGIIDISQWSTHVANRDVYHMLIIILDLISGTVGIVAGLHSVIIFSLTTMYGRTATGLRHDNAYDKFFATTAFQRVRGFQMFLWSMYAFMAQVVILIESRCPVVLKPFMILFALWLLRIVHEDTQGVMKGAECIFQPRKGKDGGKRRRRRKRASVGGVAMHGTSRRVLTANSSDLVESWISRNGDDDDEIRGE